MKLISTLVLLLYFSTSFSQWTRIQQLPSTDIASLYHTGNTLYAGGKNVIYISRDNGLSWDSTSTIPQLTLVTSIIVYKKELYAAAPNKGVFKSQDGGTTWQNISTGIFRDVADFSEFGGDLYAATLGNSVYKLNPFSGNRWLSFSKGLSNLSLVATSIAGNSNALIVATNDKGLYGYLAADSDTWEERFLLPQVNTNEGAYDIITAHDTLYWAGRTGRFYMSTDNGLHWNLFGNRLVTANTSIVNAKQALVLSTHFFSNASFNTAFFYTKKDSLQNPFVNFSIVAGHFSYKIDILGDKIWDASDRGLFFMPLSNLPGITAGDDSLPIVLPVRFISFNATCQSNSVVLRWKTAQEQNNSHFDIEQSTDGIHWMVIGNQPASGNSATEKSYSFADNLPLQNNFYRIGEFDLDGRVQYSTVILSSCNTTNLVSIRPNPVHDRLFINIVSGNTSQATISIFDSRATLVKTQRADLLKGSNQLSTDIKLLASGIYFLSVTWNDGQMNKTIRLVKQ